MIAGRRPDTTASRDGIGDFRAPDILRFGLPPLYLRYADIVDVVERLRDVCLTRSWDKPEYCERAAVTKLRIVVVNARQWRAARPIASAARAP